MLSNSRMRIYASILWATALVAAALCGAGAAPTDTPMRHGVVFFCPEKPAEAIRELELIKRDGYDLIKFSSWVWTLPKPGSQLEQTAQAVLDWCDRNGMGVFLLHNIQYGNPSEAAGLNDQVLHPEKALPYVTDWARVLHGHPSVLGVILGNEVGPRLGDPQEAPELWRQFRAWLAQEHGGIDRLNSAWRNNYRTFDEIMPPTPDQPGWVDCRRYERLRFAQFYGYLFDHGFRPQLGEKLHGNKTNTDPFLHRACVRMTMTCWDDLIAMHPLWEIKCAADTTGKPVFNAELHLYNVRFAWPAASRYRYFTSALLGEYMSAAFAWGLWNEYEVSAETARAAPGILRDLRRVDKQSRAIAAAYERADLAVLVTEEHFLNWRNDGAVRNPLAILYAHMAALAKPWRYLLEDDIATLKRGTLVVWTKGLRPSAAQALADLPKSVRVIAVNAPAQLDEYGRPLPADLQRGLHARTKVVPLGQLDATLGAQPGLPMEYRQVGKTYYFWWSDERGNYPYAVPYCLLEAKRARTSQGLLVAVINNTQHPRRAPIPWAAGKHVVDLVSGAPVETKGTIAVRFEPLAVRLFLIKVG